MGAMSTQSADAFSAWETAGFGERALEYHRFAVPFTSRATEPLLDAAEIGPGAHVLDVATGPGYVAAACLARGATAVGVDLAAGMVSLARRLHPDIEFLEADAQRLPFPDGSFDAVVGNFAILHLPRPEQAVREFTRLLVPRGRVALSTWDLPERARHVGVFIDSRDRGGCDLPGGPSGGPALLPLRR
jgi:SAM-dependent methyltransferase